MNKLCNICEKEPKYEDGGVALMITFVRNGCVNLVNVSLCGECFEKYASKPLRTLDEKCGLHIDFADKKGE